MKARYNTVEQQREHERCKSAIFRSQRQWFPEGAPGMSQHSEHLAWDMGSGWSTISADHDPGFTIWLTGLPGSGKTTLARLVKKALAARGYRVENIDAHNFSHWLHLKLSISEDMREDASHTIGYDAFITYLCVLLARNGIISIMSSVSPHLEARNYARKQIQRFIEVYLHCAPEQRQKRLAQSKSNPPYRAEQLYESPTTAELSLDTTREPSERTALRLIAYLEEHSFIAPLWEDIETDEENACIKSRLQALGYLE